MRRAWTSWLTIMATGVLLGVSAPTSAQTAAGIEGVRPEVHLDIDWHAHLGFGARLDIPVVPDGFIASTRDELALSPGVDLFLGDDHGGNRDGELFFAVPFAVQWNFYLKDWSLFPELGLVLLTGHHHGGRNHDHAHLRLLFSLGARYHFSTRNAFVMRLTWPTGLQLGITF